MRLFRKPLACSGYAIIAALVLFCGKSLASAAPVLSAPPKKLGAIELNDQYDAPQKLTFPTTNITVLTIADKKGSEQMDSWITALKAHYAGRIDLRGLADVRGVPQFLRGGIRKKFQAARRYPVMMDWSGDVCTRLGFQPGVANILIIGTDGTVCGSFAGVAVEPNLGEAFTVLDRALAR